MLGLLGSAGAVALVGRVRPGFTLSGLGPSLDCVVRPIQTEGPYFVDELLHHADIRVDPTDQAVKDGVPLSLKLTVQHVDRGSCSPLPGAQVDLWQCDALGVYSDVRDFNGLFDTRGKKFLRGFQVTDRNGTVGFTTIYPGWYSGRTPHIHFKIRLFPEGRQAYEFTSQLYFDEAVTDQVYAQGPYNAKGARDTRNAQDGIFTDNGAQLMLPLSKAAHGYVGAFDIGLHLA